MFGTWIIDFLLIAMAVVGIGVVAFYMFSKWSYKKMGEHQELIERTRQSATIFVIDKSRGRLKPGVLPKAVTDQMPRSAKLLKMNFIKAKVGPQIVTLVCDNNIYKAIPLKKNIKVEVSGIYISSMQGLKTKEEIKAMKKNKKEKEKK